MEDKIDKIIEDIGNIKVDIAKLPDIILERAENKFAKKWVADAVKFFIGATTVILITAILSLVIK